MPDTWKAEGEPLTQNAAASDQPRCDCVATPAPGVSHVNLAFPSQLHLSLTNMTFTEESRMHCQAERPSLAPVRRP